MQESSPSPTVAMHSQDTPENPLNLAGDRTRVNDALHVQNLVKQRKYLDALTTAETKAAYGDLFKTPDGDDMIAVDSNFKTEHHYHAPTAQTPQPKPLPAWVKVGAIVAALAGTGAGGAWLANAFSKPGGAATSPSTEYQLDFWQPEPAK